MSDLLMILIVVGFFLLMWGFVVMCKSLMED